MQEDTTKPESQQSDVWQELLGSLAAEAPTPTSQDEKAVVPPLESDPWSELLQAKGIEIIDLQQVHLHMSDQDVERLLKILQDQS